MILTQYTNKYGKIGVTGGRVSYGKATPSISTRKTTQQNFIHRDPKIKDIYYVDTHTKEIMKIDGVEDRHG